MEINKKNLTEPERQIHQVATEILSAGTDAPSFTARFFGPQGELSRLWKTGEDRQRIVRSELYRWLKAEIEQIRARDAARFEQELKLSPSRLTVVVPRSLHAALKSEAASEGVSLSELIRLKLSIPYRQMAALLVPKTG